MKNNNVLWAGRLEDKPDTAAFEFQSSIRVDKRLALDDILGSKVHAAMLAKGGIISDEDFKALDKAFAEMIEEQIDDSIDEYEDVHSYIEARLKERLGDVGRKIHAGRSRNDQVVTDLRLYILRILPDMCKNFLKQVDATLNTASLHLETIMPGYTHLQRAQPVTLAHWICAWETAIIRDISRFVDALKRMNECPLGSGALAGSGLPLDRAFTAKELGFERPTLNSMDSVADRDFVIEIVSDCAIMMTHLSRFCEDIVLWSSQEFGFINLADKWSTGSSIMPQKKNPDFAELIRGKAARVEGNLVTLITLMKGLPYAYDKDLQEDKEALFDSLDTLEACSEYFWQMFNSASFNKEKMKAACIGGFMEATDAADYLVRKGMPFRTAHEVVAKIVRHCIDTERKAITELPFEELHTFSEFFEEDVYTSLEPEACVAARKTSGGPAPEEVKKQIEALRARSKELAQVSR
ncbi:MAG: argininosuccinate lyase [Spirochaetaceae bacterium]|jgi:argininosuccinate lyase|nr:argininosuccinate lyase [Spirochaetaceae bacterium]